MGGLPASQGSIGTSRVRLRDQAGWRGLGVGSAQRAPFQRAPVEKKNSSKILVRFK